MSSGKSDPDIMVRFLRSQCAARWDATAESLLEFAEAQGLSPPFCCRSGVCNTCLSPLVSGAVDYFKPPVCEPPPGEILLCCARPTESVEIDI